MGMGKVTYKIDRLLSGSNGLELGIRTGVALKVDSLGENKDNYLKLTSLIGFQTSPTYQFGLNNVAAPSDWGNYTERATDEFAINKSLLPNVGWVEGLVGIRIGFILNYLQSAYLVPGNDHIAISAATGDSATTPKKSISLNPLYSTSEWTLVNNEKVHTVAPPTNEGAVANGTDLENSNKFITGFETDEYGKITKVYGRAVSTSDIGDVTNVDNYRAWGLSVGGTVLPVQSYYGGEKNGSTNVVANNLVIGSGAAIAPVLNNNTLLINLQVDGSHFVIEAPQENAQTVLKLSSFENSEQTTLGIYKTKIDATGRITESSSISNADIMSYVDTFATNTSGIVPKKVDGTNVASSAANTMYFLNSSAQWVQIPYDKVQVDQVQSNTNYALLGAASFSSSGLYSAAAHSSAYLDSSGTVHGTFAGNGSGLTNIDAGNVTSINNSKINSNILNISTLKPLLGLNVVDNANKSGQIVISTTDANSNNGVLDTIPNSITSPSANTDVAVLSANMTSNGTIAETPAIGWRNLKTLITGVVAGEGGMRFMGVVGSASGETAWTSVATSFKKGDFYKLGTINNSWDYGGYVHTDDNNLIVEVESGDTMIAIKDMDNSYASASAETKRSYWSVIQSNLINAVAAIDTPSADGTYYLPFANDTSMTRIFNGATVTRSDGNWTINATVAHSNDAVSLKTARTIWGQSFNGTAPIAGAMTDVGTITPQAGDGGAASTATVGTQAAPFAAAYITTVNGTTFTGTASTADQLVRPLILQFGNTSWTFDGSAVSDADRTFTFSADALDVFDNIEGTTADSGNVVSGVSITRKSNEGNDRSVISYTVTKTNVLDNVSSGIFNLTKTSNTVAVAPYSDKQASSVGLHFYTGATLPSAPETSGLATLRLEGILNASKMQVIHDNGAHDVVSKRSDTLSSIDATKNILVADAASGDYGFVASSVHIGSQSGLGQWSTATDTVVPTQAAVKAYVDQTSTAISAATKVECMAIPFSTQHKIVMSKTNWGIPADAIIDHIDVVIEAAFDNAATFTLTDGGTTNSTVISNTEVDLTSANDVFSFKFGLSAAQICSDATHSLTTEMRPKVTVVTSGNSGAGTCYLYYTKQRVEQFDNLSVS